MPTEPHQKFILQDEDQSIKSSAIKIQGKLTAQNGHTKSLCHQEIISENCEDESFQNDQLYNEESSLPLCMKEYYINEKEVKGSSQRGIEHSQYNSTQQQQKQSAVPAKDLPIQKLKLIGYQNPTTPIPTPFTHQTQQSHYHSTVEQRNKILSFQLQNERIKNLHFEKMLTILIEQDEIQRKKFQTITNDYHDKIQLLKDFQTQNRSIKAKNEELQKEITHYKDLIYLANNNYQTLQAKLQDATTKILLLEIERQEREKLNHQKLQNLKQVMKSLMANLKGNPNIASNDSKDLPQFRIDSKDVTENCYSFGDHDYNTLREKKDRNSSKEKKIEGFGSFGNHNPKGKAITTFGNNEKFTGKNPMIKKTFDKENLFLTQKIDDSFENKNFSSNKTTLGKLKSPKNLTVQENYRKLFMKTLISSAQKSKTENN